MVVGAGIDLIEVARISASIERYGDRFLNRIFTAGEIAYCRQKKAAAESFAARFAAKEAAAKALGTGIQRGVTWQEIEVHRLAGQRPSLLFAGRAAEVAAGLHVRSVSLSLTHDRTTAMALVILENG